MAQIRYTGLPTQFQTGLGDKLTASYADFALAKLPQELMMMGVKNVPTAAAGKAATQQQALQKLMSDLQDKQKEQEELQNRIMALQAQMRTGM